MNLNVTIVTFSRKKSREVGCGIYRLTSSIVLLCSITLFTMKFWFLFLSHRDHLGDLVQQNILSHNCLGIELVLKIALYVDNWLGVCVAIERTFSVFHGINFDKKKSKRIASVISILLPIIITCLFIPQILKLRVFKDEMEQRSWCVVRYSPSLQIYISVSILFHYFTPLLIYLSSALFIIITTIRRRGATQTDRKFTLRLVFVIAQYRHLLITPAIILCLTLPHLIIAVTLDCNKASRLFWFHLIGYFLSFIPAASVFIIFVIPSTVVKQEFDQLLAHIHRRLMIFKLNSSTLR
jgi:hypothetical protein